MAVYLKEAKAVIEQDLRSVTDAVREILDRVRREGRSAVRYYSKKFDNWHTPDFRITDEAIENARKTLSAQEREDIDFCQEQIRNFARKQREAVVDFESETLPGVHLGQKIIPVGSCGSYIR